MPRPKLEVPTETLRIHLNAEVELHERIKKEARANRMSMGAYCLRMIELGMKSNSASATLK